MKWKFEELIDGITFDELVEFPELVEERYELVSLSPSKITGFIRYNEGDDDGYLKYKIQVEAEVLAANTGVEAKFADSIEDYVLISEMGEDIVDIRRAEIDITSFIKESIDLFIPSHFVDEANSLEVSEGNHWRVIDESTFINERQKKKNNEFSKLSAMLKEKNKK